MRKNFNRGQRRDAFTLMELLLAMSILVIMGGLATYAFMNMGTNARMDAMLTQIRTYEGACMQYKIKHNRFPNKLEDLHSLPQGFTQRQWGGPFVSKPITNDIWGTPFTYSKEEQMNKVLISSAGPDGQINTVDDIPDPNDPNA